MGNFLTSWEPVSFWRRTVLHGVSKQAACSSLYGDVKWMYMSGSCSFPDKKVQTRPLWPQAEIWGNSPADTGAWRTANTRTEDLLGMDYFCVLRHSFYRFVNQLVAKPWTSHPCYCRSAISAQLVAGIHLSTFVRLASDTERTSCANLRHAPLDVFTWGTTHLKGRQLFGMYWTNSEAMASGS